MNMPVTPVLGYRQLTSQELGAMNVGKLIEESVLQFMERIPEELPDADRRWLAIGKTNLEQAFMSIQRSIARPARVTLPDELADEDPDFSA